MTTSPLRRLLISFVVALSAFGGSAHAEDDPAITRVKTYCDALLDTMKSAAARTPVKKRYDKLDPAIRAMFDLPAMTRTAVGPTWTTLSPEDQQSIVDAFSRFTIATYAARFDGYSGEHFDVDPKADERGENRMVHTAIVKADGSKVPLNYLMHSTPAGWKATDVYLSGTISELATRRSEFASLLKNGGPTALVDRLKAQTEKQLGSA